MATISSNGQFEESDYDATKISIEEARRLSNEHKCIYFNSVRWAHPRHREVLAKVLSLARPDSGTDVVLLIGPTGVGKSTLIGAMKNIIIRDAMDSLIEDPGYRPIVIVVAPSSGENKFSWRMFYQKVGDGLAEPFMDSKHRIEMVNDRAVVRFVTSGATVAGMKMAIENVLRTRRTKILVIDESPKMLRVVTGKALGIHFDALQSLSDIPGLTLVLAGSYDLLEIPTLNGQIARRSNTTHYSRYQFDGGKDQREFQQILTKFMEYWVLEHRFDVVKWQENLHIASLGCCGILKKILNNAFKQASNSSKWNDDFLKTSVFTKGEYESILSEILEGEMRIQEFIHGPDPIKDLKELKRTLEVNIQGGSSIRSRRGK